MLLCLLLACSAGLGGCGREKIPEKYAALGIPPLPELVASTTKVKGSREFYSVEYKPGAPWGGRPTIDMLARIRAAGYEEVQGPSTANIVYYEGAQGRFRLDLNPTANPPTLFLWPDRPAPTRP
jgi:hypothetical protein